MEVIKRLEGYYEAQGARAIKRFEGHFITRSWNGYSAWLTGGVRSMS